MPLSLPNSKIAEQVILTHILLNKQGTDTIFSRISVEMFYSNDYKIIYQAICDLKGIILKLISTLFVMFWRLLMLKKTILTTTILY